MWHLKINIRKASLLLFLLSVFGIFGCTAAMNQTGTDTEVEIYSYLTGMLTRTYAYEYHHTVQTVRNTLEKLKIPIADTIADGLKTEFKARRADETPVAIEIVLIDRDHTQVSVSTGTVGVWDRRVSEQIHGYIAEALDEKTIEDEKLPEEPAKTEAQPVVDEVVQPEIVEENLAEDSKSPAVQTAAAGDQIFPDSPNVIFFGQDSNELSDTAMAKLDRIYEMLTDNP